MIKTSLPPALVEFMHRHQYRPEPLKPSGGGFFRFPVGNKVNGNASGYVKLFPDGNIAVFGDFKSGQQITWHAKNLESLSPPERKAYQVQIEKAGQEAKKERDRLHAEAAERASRLYNAGTNANPDHPYLFRKSIRPHDSLRQLGKQLIIPVYIEGKLTSLQFIKEDGSKLFLKDGEIFGGYCLLGEPAKVVCIAEGYATGYSIHEVTGHSVAVAFNAGNLLPVARAIRRNYPASIIILCADHDQWTEGNPGLTKASEAAAAIGGFLAVPDFSSCDTNSHPTDFNDLHRLVGGEAVLEAITAAKEVGNTPTDLSRVSLTNVSGMQNAIAVGDRVACADQRSSLQHSPDAALPPPGKDKMGTVIPIELDSWGRTATKRTSSRELEVPLAPPVMAPEGFPPLIRDIVEVACEHSEAHPVAVAGNCLAYFSAVIGRGVFQELGDAQIHCRPFILIAGKSGRARKGTSEATVRKIFKRVDTLLNKHRGVDECLHRHNGGLSTGEGIARVIRDPVEGDEKGSADPGVADKRLLVVESEFANLFSQLRRDGNTLSASIRILFDGLDLEPLTKTKPLRASRPHVCIIGHVTAHELREKSTENDMANGLLNRFMMLYVYRPKHVSRPKPTAKETIDLLAERVSQVILKVTGGGDLRAENVYKMCFDEAAEEFWDEKYPLVTRDREGKVGSLLARSDMYVWMLSMIFAAMDGRHTIEPQDLKAALAWVEYWNDSVTYIFNCPYDDEGLDPFVIEVLETIKNRPGIKLTELQEKWHNKRIPEVKNALELLLSLAPPFIEQRKIKTPGRPALTYYPYEEK